MPSHPRTAMINEPAADQTTPAASRHHAAVPVRQHTPDEIVALVNNGEITADAGEGLMRTLGEPPIKLCRQATFTVPIAVHVPADTGPAAAISVLDEIVAKGTNQMSWTIAKDGPDGYAIDPPDPPGDRPGLRHSTVHADLRLTVTVPAYRRYKFQRTARDLLHQDLQQLCDLAVQVGAARLSTLRKI